MVPYYTVMDQRLGRSRTLQTCYYRKYTWLKGSPDPSHCTVQINIEKGRSSIERLWNGISRSTKKRLNMASFKFRVVLRRIRLFPTLISKIKWLGSELPLKLNNCRHEMLNKSRCHSDDVSSILMIIHQIKCISETVSSHVCNVDIKSHQVDLVRYVIPCVMRCLWFWYTKWQGLYLFQKKVEY